MTSPADLPAARSFRPRLGRRAHWLLRSALAIVSTLVALFVGDRLVGLVANTAQRHRLRLAPNVAYRHRSTEFDYVFRTNSLGLRGPEVPVARPAGTRRIAVLGDSFVAGYGVADADVLTAHLARLLAERQGQPPAGPAEPAQFQVLNLGRVGSSTIRELEVYLALGQPYRADVVVLLFCAGNDLREIMEEQDREEIRRWRPDGWLRRAAYALGPNLYLELAIWKQHLETRRRLGPRSQGELLAVVDQLARQYGADPGEARRHYLGLPLEVRTTLEQGLADDWRILPPCFDPERLKRAIEPDNRYFDRAWPRVERHLDLLRRAVEADGGTLVVALIPDAVQADRDAYEFARSLGYHVAPEWLVEVCRVQQALESWARSAGVPYLDLADDFRRSSKPLFYPQDGHFNPAGHAEAARKIEEFLAAEGLLDERGQAAPSRD